MVDRSGQNIGHCWKTGIVSLVVTILVGGCVIVRPENNIPASLEPRAKPTSLSDATAVITTNPTWLPSQTPTSTSSPTQVNIPAIELPEEIIDSTGVIMRLVPAGSFTMGSDGGDDDEKPVHTFTLGDYYMDVFEVTNAQYKACVDAGGCTLPYSSGSYTRSNYYGKSQYDNYPVINVDWRQAKAYCRWRGARLPTEAEWEKAARGTDGRTYPWGKVNTSSSLLNYNTNVGDTTEVGSYEGGLSPYGMYDMAGNVWEWVNDWYASMYYYQGKPTENPQGPSEGSEKVLRGSAWDNNINDIRSSNRNHINPTYTNNNIGFRCANLLLDPTTLEVTTEQIKITPATNTLPDEFTDFKGVTMRLVPSGIFTMGSDNGLSDEMPVHAVMLDDFYMDTYEITNAQYKACVDAGACTEPDSSESSTRSSYYKNSQFNNYPVIFVSWNQAKIYCEWRGARLPTEAEWEKAARGTDGRIYPWGNANPSNSLVNYNGNMRDTTEIGSYENGKSPYGIYDMSGNVWEWVNDWYGEKYYQVSPTENPLGPSEGPGRNVRGGGWGYLEDDVRSSYRGRPVPNDRGEDVGFRCARDANP